MLDESLLVTLVFPFRLRCSIPSLEHQLNREVLLNSELRHNNQRLEMAEFD
jgi:hypothetical protein